MDRCVNCRSAAFVRLNCFKRNFRHRLRHRLRGFLDCLQYSGHSLLGCAAPAVSDIIGFSGICSNPLLSPAESRLIRPSWSFHHTLWLSNLFPVDLCYLQGSLQRLAPCRRWQAPKDSPDLLTKSRLGPVRCNGRGWSTSPVKPGDWMTCKGAR